MFIQALEEINQQYESGTIHYVRENHPLHWKKTVESENHLSDLWLAGGIKLFREALEEWLNLNLGAIKTFPKRVTQKTLFD